MSVLDDLSAAPAATRNFLRHVASLSMTKTADGLVNPKLVLSWLMVNGAAPAWAVGLLVPVREAGALLPQLLVSARIGRLRHRKWVWAGASVVQGAAALMIAAAAWGLDGLALGLAVVAALALLAVARSGASASYKDILGRTVRQGRRGTATGLAGSISAAVLVCFALLLMTGTTPRFATVLVALGVAGLLWLVAGAVMAGLDEPAADPDDAPKTILGQLRYIREDTHLARFVLVRGLLTGSALAPPYMVLLGGEGAFGALGSLLLASALAGLVSATAWGWLADRSGRAVMALAGVLAALAVVAEIVLAASGALTGAGVAVTLFVLLLAHQGVRLGRSTYLVDMAPEGKRAAYTAAANTVIGIILLVAGGLGAVASLFGATAVLGLFAALCAAAAPLAFTLPPTSTGAADG